MPSARPSSDQPLAPPRKWVVLAGAALVTLVVAIYAPVGQFGFLNLDDDQYVTQNQWVRAGLTTEGVTWAFTAFHAANWHPLTWLSHMADVELFGLDPGRHHQVNVLLHALDTVLLFLFLLLATGATWRSALAAALFAVHPLHVESVAWISERKDVLSTLFWLVTCLAWLGYVRRPSPARYAGVMVAYGLGLLAKPMLVTLPLVLLLLDAWPLRRLPRGRPWVRGLRPLVMEKLPMLAMAAASTLVTWLAQSRGGGVLDTVGLSLPVRLGNAMLSAATYLWQSVWPARLAALYPHPGLLPSGLSGVQVAVSSMVLLGLSAVAAWQWRPRPWLGVGWLWFLVTLLPVVGIVQVGDQGHADRYTYVPLIGIFVALAWSVPFASSRSGRAAVGAASMLVIGGLSLQARRQVSTWRDSVTMFEHAISMTDGNYHAWRGLGSAHLAAGRLDRAIPALQESLRLQPEDPNTWMNLGFATFRAGRPPESRAAFEQALRRNPDDPTILLNLGVVAATQRDWARVEEVRASLARTGADRVDELDRRVRRFRPGSPPLK
jgi:hypothetical protein